MNLERIYEYRFRNVDQSGREAVWKEISNYLYEQMGNPESILDPAAGRCEFINSVPAKERWIVDQMDAKGMADSNIKVIRANVMEAELPSNHFEAVFVSNFLEHLSTPNEISRFLSKMKQSLKVGGRIVILGPNYKYCGQDYFDCADHILPLTHISVAEHLFAAGFDVTRIVGKFLPFSFRGLLPPSPSLTRLYLKLPPAWKLFGKQFLVIGKK